MLNVGSNYTSFSNYSPAYRARCGQGKTRLLKGGGGGTCPLPGLGAARPGVAEARGRDGGWGVGRAPVGGAAGSGRLAAERAGTGARRFSGVC